MCSLNWQHQLCKNPRPNPDIKTLFTDHTCSPPNGARTSPVSVPLAAVPKAGPAYQPLTGHPVCFLYNIISCLCAIYDPFVSNIQYVHSHSRSSLLLLLVHL